VSRRRESWDDRSYRYEREFEERPYRTGWKWFWRIFWTFIVLGVLTGIVGLILNLTGAWANKAAEVVAPPNVEKQFTRVIDNWEALYASAENACIAQSNTDENSPTFVESPEAAYAATFRKIVIDYNRRQANIFEAGFVGPPGYPKEVPRSLGADGEWCDVPAQLDALQAVSE